MRKRTRTHAAFGVVGIRTDAVPIQPPLLNAVRTYDHHVLEIVAVNHCALDRLFNGLGWSHRLSNEQ